MRVSHCVRWAIAIALCAVAVLAIRPAVAAEKVTVILDYGFPESEMAGMQLPVVKGWYKEAGLDVDIQFGKGSVVTIQQVAAGQADMGIAQLSAVAASISKGLPVMGIMSMLQNSDIALIMGAELGLKSPKEAKGKVINVASGSTAAVLMPSFFKNVGLSMNDVTLTYVDSSTVFTAFGSKSIDGLVSGATSILPRVEAKRPGVAFYFSDAGLNLPGYGLMTRNDLIKSRPEVLRKMVQINQRAWAYIMDGHQQEAIDALDETGKQFRMDKAATLEEMNLMLPRFQTANNKGHPVGWQSKQDWENSLKVMEAAELVKPGWKVEDYFDNRFIGDIGHN